MHLIKNKPATGMRIYIILTLEEINIPQKQKFTDISLQLKFLYIKMLVIWAGVAYAKKV